MKLKMKLKLINRLLLAAAIGMFSLVSIHAQTSAFTYQGRFTDSTVPQPTNGTYNMQFALFGSIGGADQIGSTVTVPTVAVAGGVFTVNLDFTQASFPAGASRFLEIRVFNQTTAAYVTLTARQPLTSSPYSIRTLSATAADGLSGVCNPCVTDAQIVGVAASKVSGTVANATNAGTASNALNLGGVPASGYLPTTGGTLTGNLTVGGVIAGNGSGLTNLPGAAGFTWQVSGILENAVSNRGYIVDNFIGRAYIILPAAPNVGDTVRISGVGAGGWRLAQNAGQFVSSNSIKASVPFTPRESIRNWTSIASSADGTKLAAGSSGQIYTSINSGATWTARESNRSWVSIASSANGANLAAVGNGNQIYTSADSGASWSATESIRNWTSITSSTDGTKLAAVAISGQIYISADSGITWKASDSIRGWTGIASSADGAKLTAVAYSEQIYTSSAPETTVGTSGFLTGNALTTVELQYVGAGKFVILSREGVISGF